MESQKDSIARSAGLVSIATFLSRILGLVRELIVARFFGAGLATDAFNVAFRIPNLLRDLFAEGALSSAFVPQFTQRLTKGGKPEAFALGNKVTSCLVVVVGTICLAGIAGADPLVRAMAPGFAEIPGKIELTVTMTRVMMFFLLLIALAAAAMGMLNSLGRFFVPALSPCLLSVGMILGATTLTHWMGWLHWDPAVALAVGVMVGGAGQLGAQLPSLWKEGWRPRFDPDFKDDGTRKVAGMMLPATLGLAATQINVFVNTWLASTLAQGSVSWLSYAFRLMQLPIGVFGVSVGNVTQPAVSRMLAEGKKDEVLAQVSHSLTLVTTFNLPASAGLVVLSEPIVRLVYESGRFNPADTQATALALEAYCVGLFAFSASKVIVPVYYALGDSSAPARNSFVAVALNLLFSLLLMRFMGHAGLALAASIAGLTSLSLLILGLRSRLGALPSTLPSTLRIGAATLVMGFACKLSAEAIATHTDAATLAGRLAQVGVPIGVGVVALLGSLALMRAPELETFQRIVRRRRGKA